MKKTLIAFIISIPLILIVGYYKPQSENPQVRSKVYSDRFWALKVTQKPIYDMVIIGDSRTYRGIAPQAINESLPDYKIYNFAFSSGGLNKTIYKEAENLLNNNSDKPKIILIGATPYSLTKDSSLNKHYKKENERPLEEKFQRIYVNPLLKFIFPIKITALQDKIRGEKEKLKLYYYQDFYDNGWVASYIIPNNDEEQLDAYKRDFTKWNISDKLVNDLVEQIKRWKNKGIKIFVLRPPTTEKMELLENKLSGYVEFEIKNKIEKSGGYWITLENRYNYKSYDGSHLHKDSAFEFSNKVGHFIANKIKEL